MTQDSTDQTQAASTGKLIGAAVLAIAVIVGLAVGSNKILDDNEIADEAGLTISQQKEKARINQEQWDRRKASSSSTRSSAKMCAEAGIVVTVKKLISDQTPNIGQLSDTLRQLDAARGGGRPDLLQDREKNLRDTKDWYARNPVDPNDHSQGDQVAARAKRLVDLEAEVTSLRAKAGVIEERTGQLRNAKNEILVVGEPIPTDFDPNLNRALCQLTYKVKGLGYDNPMMQVNLPTKAVYTVQPGQQDWVVTLLSIS